MLPLLLTYSLSILRHMTLNQFLVFTALSLLPISELRGAIPYGLAVGGEIWWIAPLAVIINALVPFVAFLFLDTVHKLLLKLKWYEKYFTALSARAVSKIHAKVEKYGYAGLLVFVAIPLPVTGAWTGALGAWLLAMNRKKSALMIIAGVAVAGVIVSLVLLLGIKSLNFFIKKI